MSKRIEDGSPGTVAGSRPSGYILELSGLIAASISVLTVVIYHFVRIFLVQELGYFGIDIDVVQFSIQDYLVASVNLMFQPVSVLLVVSLFGIWGYIAIRDRLKNNPRPLFFRRLPRGGISIGLLLFGFGLLSSGPVLYRALVFMSGSILIGCSFYSLYMRRIGQEVDPATDPRWYGFVHVSVMVLLIIVGLVPLGTYYAGRRGIAYAHRVEAGLSRRPRVVVYSREPLHIGTTVVEEKQLGSSGYRFQYTGLTFFLHSDGKYILMPAKWSKSDGIVVVLSESDMIRLEIMANPLGRAP
jgi:hypothetical protein